MTLIPKNWKEFQHYKDRDPVWIKLHRQLLDDYEFHCLPVASKALAPMLWLLASCYDGGAITLSPEAIAFRLRMSVSDLVDALKPLIDSGFFIDASNTLASCKQSSIPEKETEREKEKEKEKDSVTYVTGANAPIDTSIEEKQLFVRGKQVLGKASGGLIAKLLRSRGGNVALARSAIEAASTKQDPSEYVAAIIRGPPQGSAQAIKDARKQSWSNMYAKLDASIDRDGEREADGEASIRVLPGGRG